MLSRVKTLLINVRPLHEMQCQKFSTQPFKIGCLLQNENCSSHLMCNKTCHGILSATYSVLTLEFGCLLRNPCWSSAKLSDERPYHQSNLEVNNEEVSHWPLLPYQSLRGIKGEDEEPNHIFLVEALVKSLI